MGQELDKIVTEWHKATQLYPDRSGVYLRCNAVYIARPLQFQQCSWSVYCPCSMSYTASTLLVHSTSVWVSKLGGSVFTEMNPCYVRGLPIWLFLDDFLRVQTRQDGIEYLCSSLHVCCNYGLRVCIFVRSDPWNLW